MHMHLHTYIHNYKHIKWSCIHYHCFHVYNYFNLLHFSYIAQLARYTVSGETLISNHSIIYHITQHFITGICVCTYVYPNILQLKLQCWLIWWLSMILLKFSYSTKGLNSQLSSQLCKQVISPNFPFCTEFNIAKSSMNS